jgi:hypothetical protein
MAVFMLSARTMNLEGLRPVVGAKGHDVSPGHSRADIAKKPGESKADQRYTPIIAVWD